MQELGYTALLVASFMSSTILPLGSEAIVVAMLLADFNTAAILAIATVGNWAGSMTTYALGYAGNWQRIERWLRMSESQTAKYRQIIDKYGYWTGLMAWLPAIGDVLTLALGLFRTPVGATALTILAGKALRYAILAAITLQII